MSDDAGKMPCALIVMGVSGSGKSTIADKLAERLGWTLRGRRQISSREQCRQNERRPSPHRRRPLALATGDRRRNRPGLRGRRACRDRLLGAEAHLSRCSRAWTQRCSYRLSPGHAGVDRQTYGRPQETISCRPACWTASSRRWSRRTHDENPVTVSIDASVDAIVDDIVRQLRSRPADGDANSRNRCMTRIALVVSDVDGTLLTKDKTLDRRREGAPCGGCDERRHRLHHYLQPSDHRHAVPDRATANHAAGRRVQRQFASSMPN